MIGIGAGHTLFSLFPKHPSVGRQFELNARLDFVDGSL